MMPMMLGLDPEGNEESLKGFPGVMICLHREPPGEVQRGMDAVETSWPLASSYCSFPLPESEE